MLTGVSRPLRCAAGALALAFVAAAAAAQTPTLADAQRHFYNGDYATAAAQALLLRTADPQDLAAYELRSSALHFRVRRLLGEPKDKGRAFTLCEPCGPLFALFLDETSLGQAAARARLRSAPADQEARFFLGKINLNYVWMQLGTLGRRTAWSEFREARRSLDAVVKADPGHIRARVARAWIDYIVDTEVPRGFKWILGGGSRKRGLAAARDAADAQTDVFTLAEARFALWEMLIRERRFAEATAAARELARDFPENRDIIKFLASR